MFRYDPNKRYSAGSKPVLSNTETITFRTTKGATLQLTGSVVSWTDTRKPTLVEHKFLKRDGARQESMGRESAKVRFNLVYVGQNQWMDQYRQLLQAIDDDPYGTLSHPVYGSIQVACQGVDGVQVDTENAIDTITVPISFVENNLDTVFRAENLKTVSSETEVLSAQASAMVDLFSAYSGLPASATGAANDYAAEAEAFAVAAQASALLSVVDTSLLNRLNTCSTKASAAKTALYAAASSNASVYDLLAQIYLVLAQCFAVDVQLRKKRGSTVKYNNPSPAHIAVICAQFYGKNAIAMIDEVLAMNPSIRNPAAVPSGYTVLLPPKTR